MIRVTYFIVCLLLGITLVSCIRDEALNAEADILTCTVSGDILKRDPIIENNKVVLMVTADADLTHQAPEFTLTPGATISPASGTERDFTTPQSYTVTSEDGNWKKEYQVTYIIAGISSEYHFENVKDYKSSLLKYVYNIFYENDSEGKMGNGLGQWKYRFCFDWCRYGRSGIISDFILCGRKGGQMRKVGNKVDWGFRFEVGYAYCCR